MSTTDTDRIRELNDQLRRHLSGGRAVMTPGIAALGTEAVQRLIQTIATFNAFCSANDPNGEHEFLNVMIHKISAKAGSDFLLFRPRGLALRPSFPRACLLHQRLGEFGQKEVRAFLFAQRMR